MGWKDNDDDTASDWGERAGKLVESQMLKGQTEYGYVYLNHDPLDDAEEELADAFNYVAFARLQRETALSLVTKALSLSKWAESEDWYHVIEIMEQAKKVLEGDNGGYV